MCSASSRAAPTRPASSTRSASSAINVSALHVDHGLRGAESDEDARWCAERFGAEVVQRGRATTEAELRDVRYAFRRRRRCARRGTRSPTRSRRSSTGSRRAARPTGIKVRREDGVVRPLLCVWREETEAFCRERGLEWRTDSTNPDTVRGLIRDQILPLLDAAASGARENVLRALDERRTMPPALAELLDSRAGSKRVDLGGGVQAVREHDRLWLEPGPQELRGARRAGASGGSSRTLPGLKVRGWRPGDRLAGRSKKIQDVFVDAKIPRSDREGWPLVVRGDEVVAVPGIVEAEGVTATPCRRLRSSRRRQDPDRRGPPAEADPRARPRALRRTTPGASCCSSACSRAPSSSWPT